MATWEIIRDNPKIKWNWKSINNNENITDKIIRENPNHPWKPKAKENIIISSNQTLEPYLIGYNINPRVLSEPNLPWLWDFIAVETEVPLKFIIDNPQLPWGWEYVSAKFSITWEDICNNLDKPWDWDILARNPNITWDIISANLHRFKSWEDISSNPNLTCQIICDNPNYPWDWSALMENMFNYHPYFESNKYKKKMTKKFVDSIIKEMRKRVD